MSTYTPISSVTLASAASSVTFSGIPQTYTDLVITSAPIATSNGLGLRLQFNNDTGSNYSRTVLSGYPSAAGTTRFTNQTSISSNWQVGGGIDGPSPHIHNIQNYSNSTTFKTVLFRANIYPYGGLSEVTAEVGLWRNTSAITSITLSGSTGNFASGSTFNLYGINAANSGQAKATGGDSIYRDASYWYHIFNKSGTFIPAQNLSNVDYLIVAGGGGGGANGTNAPGAGGGGAGGYRYFTSQSLNSNTSYAVTVGAGGPGGYVPGEGGQRGTSGNVSTFNSNSATGGGAGAASGSTEGPLTGGSGGGGAARVNSGNGASGNAGSYSPVEGYAGGAAGADSSPFHAGGGGGSSAVGGAPSGTAGVGGAGTTNTITGSSIAYAGGGGGGSRSGTGGAGGTGGGGSGGSNGGAGTSGTANTGGGGGGHGGGSNSAGGSGGSGIVIVRYPV